MLGFALDLVLHLDRHLVELLLTYHLWIYPILFAVIFAETGFVVTPFLPGDSLLFAVGALAAVATSGRYRLLKVEYLRRTEEFFRRHGGLAIVLSRFIPIVRTCAPFVAGIGRMPLGRFLAYNLAGGFGWVLLFIWGGYLFGNIPLVKQHFGLVTIAIVLASLVPLAS